MSGHNKSTRIIGIDPGYDRLGIAVIDKNAGTKKDLLAYSDCITTSSKDDIHLRLQQIGEGVSLVLDEYKPSEMAIETLFVTKNQKTAMRVAEARGIIIYEAMKRGVSVREYSPMQIKTAITSDGTSDKSRIFKMLGLLISLPEKEALDDEYDAIAVALAHSAIRNNYPQH